MASHLIEVLLQVVWSSLTGGWFFDPHLSIFINTVHMYAWFILFLLPFSFYIILPSNFLTWSIYSLIIFVTFTIIKLINYQLNKMFDKNKIIVNEKLIRVPKLKLKTNKRRKRKKQPNTSGINNNDSNTNINNLRTSSLLNSLAPPNAGHRNDHLNNSNQSVSLSLSQQSRVESLINNLKAYDLINENYDTENLSDLQLSNQIESKKSSKSIKSSSISTDTVTGATNLEQLFSSGMSTKSRKTIKNEAHQPVILSGDSSLSLVGLKSYKNNDKENEEDDENYSNINFEEGNYDKLQLQQNSELKKRDTSEAGPTKTLEESGNTDDLNFGTMNNPTSLPLNQQDIEENSNRSLFKISEESLHGNSNLNKHHSKDILKTSIKSKTSSKHSTSKRYANSTSGSNSSRTKNSKLNSSTSLGGDDQTTTSSICLAPSNNSNSNVQHDKNPPMSSSKNNSAEELKPRKIENIIVSFNYYEEILKKSSSQEKEPIVLQPGLRRAQSELTFDFFEKLVKKAQINFLNRSNTSDFEEDDSSKPKAKDSKPVSIFIRYKAESETLEKKINTLKLSKSCSSNQLTENEHFSGNNLNTSSKRLGAKSFHNLLSLSCAQRRCCTKNSPNSTSLSLSQQIQYQDLKQFKSTLECVKYLSKMQIDNNTNLSLRNLGNKPSERTHRSDESEFNLERIRKKLLNHNNNISNSKTLDQEKGEYEKQGARPKIRLTQQKRTYKIDKPSIKDELMRNHQKAVQVRPNERSQIPHQTNFYFVNEKEDRVLGQRRMPIRGRKSSNGSRHGKTTTNSDDYIEIGDINTENYGKANTSERTIRFESSSLKTKSSRKDSTLSNSYRRRSSKFRPIQSEEVGLVDELDRRDSKLTPVVSNIKCVPDVNNDSTSASSEEESLRNFDRFKESYDALLKKSNQKRSNPIKTAFKNYESFMEIINKDRKPIEDLEINNNNQIDQICNNEEENDSDENEYDYINNDECFDDEENDLSTGFSLLNRRKSYRVRYHHNNHYRLNNTNNNNKNNNNNNNNNNNHITNNHQHQHHKRQNLNDVGVMLFDQGMTSAAASNDSNKRRHAPIGLSHSVEEPQIQLTKMSRMNERAARTRSADNRNYDSYAAITRRQLIRSRLRLTSRLRTMNLRTNDLGDLRNPDLRHFTNPIDINTYHVISHLNNENLNGIYEQQNVTLATSELESSADEVETNVKLYKWKLTNSLSINIPFDHFSLLAMLDKNRNLIELISCIFMATCVSMFAALILCEQIYDDFVLVLFCFIVASCHYSLLKSVQPDSSSPIHGFNRLTPLSRPIYFCLLCISIIFLRFLTEPANSWFHRYHDSITGTIASKLVYFFENFWCCYGYCLRKSHLDMTLGFLEIFLLFFPLLFTFGMFPQISTFTLCVLEQIDMHCFGGTAMNNLVGAFLSIGRSLISIGILSMVLFSSTFGSQVPIAQISADQQFSQSVLFSIYCAFLVVVAYFLSRQSSDLWAYFKLIKDLISVRRLRRITKKKSTRLKRSFAETTTGTNDENKESVQLRPIKTGSISVEDSANVMQQQNRFYEKNQNNNDYISVPDTPLSSPKLSSGPNSESSSIVSSPTLKSNAMSRFRQGASSDLAGANSMTAAASIVNSNQHNTSEVAVKVEDNNKSENPVGNESKPVKNFLGGSEEQEYEEMEIQDPFETQSQRLIRLRLESDILVGIFTFIFVFALHVSTIFTVLNPILNEILFGMAIFTGALNHYIIPHLRIETPWYIFNQPLFKPSHWSIFEPNYLAKLEKFEACHLVLTFAEKNILNVLLILSATTLSSDKLLTKYILVDQYGFVSCLMITVFALKLLRNSFCEPSKQYYLYLLAYLFNKFDASTKLENNETILFNLFIISIFLPKFIDFLHKIEFIYVYTAPWQLPWGSAFHAFAQPLSAPHTSLLLLQTVISTLIGAPLMPLMGSALFLLSYIRPVKFWEKNYNTKRVDNSNTRLQSQFDTTSPDSENLNAIFYEHLASVLQQSLCGDLALGRWGNVSGGDFFILSSDYLNCLVHLIEMGNGFVTFQLRGLEFKGTYCQQRELEAITEDNSENDGCCCCKIGHFKNMLSFNASFHLRWVAWKIVSKKYIVNAYRIVDNDLSLIVNFYSLRRTLIDFYIKSAIYYSIKSSKLADWLSNPYIVKELEKFRENYIDYDTCFDSNLDLDYDSHLKGVTFFKFNSNYFKWISYCREQHLNYLKTEFAKKSKIAKELRSRSSQLLLHNWAHLEDNSTDSLLIRFCFALSLVCRRALVTACSGSINNHHTATNRIIDASHNPRTSNNLNGSINSFAGNGINAHISSSAGGGLQMPHMDTDSLSSFQHGYYTLFKGDIRIQSPKDEWIFNDMEILKRITLPAVRMGLRLHQDHFQNDNNDEPNLYENLTKFDRESVLCYERDPIWRKAVLNNVNNLLSLRHQFTEYSDQYKVVMLNKNFLSFRVIKINKECVRSFWAGQQHELIFLRNKNQERGSIQNAKQVLRNIINSSCDQPIGYPIYVSPLITSYASTHEQIVRVVGPEFNFGKIWNFLTNCFQRIRENCTNDCSGSAEHENLYGINQNQDINITFTTRPDVCNINNLNPLPMGSKLVNSANENNFQRVINLNTNTSNAANVEFINTNKQKLNSSFSKNRHDSSNSRFFI